MFWDDAESDEKAKKDKINAEKGESIDDYQNERPEKGEDVQDKKATAPVSREKPAEQQSKDKPSSGAKPSSQPSGGKQTAPPPSGGKATSQPTGAKPAAPPQAAPPKTTTSPKGAQTTADQQKEDPNKVAQPREQNRRNEKDNIDNNAQDSENVYVDKNKEENPEYVFVPINRPEEEPKGNLIFGILRVVASAPVIVTFFSLSHIIRKIPVKYLMMGCAITPIHFILSLFMISDISKEDTSKDVSYTSLTNSSCPPLSIIVSIYLFVMKYLTCIFMVDMFLETIYAVFPESRLDEFSLGFAKIFFLILISLFLVALILTYKSLPIALHGLNIVLIAAAIILLICIAFFSKLEVRKFANITSGDSEISLSDILFLGFSFISFACECQSVSVMVFKKNKSGYLVISIISVLSILFFLFLLTYFGDWILQKSLSETLGIILPSYSDFNRSLKDSKSDSYNLLSRSSFFSCLVISLIGFVLQMNILSRSLISIFAFLKRASDIVGFIVTFLLVLSLVILVVIKDIGRVLWMTTRVVFFGFPLYAMYPYLAELTKENSNKLMFILSIVLILILCFFVYLSFYDVSILKPSNF